MHVTIRLGAAFAAGLLTLSCDVEGFGPAERRRENFQYVFDMKPGERLTVDNANGSVEIRGWDQNKIEVSGYKYAASDDALKALRVEVSVSGGVAQVRTHRPSLWQGNYGVHYVIRTPRKVNLDKINSTNGAIRAEDIEGAVRLSTTNGSLNLRRVRGPVDASTTNGAVELYSVEGTVAVRTTNGSVRGDAVRGSLDASTSNGVIEARVAEAGEPRPMRFSTTNGAIKLTLEALKSANVRASTTNGAITLRLPPSVGARVDARSSNATVSTDFAMTSKGEVSKKRLQGTIGAGGPTLDLSTSNGPIKILKM